MLNITERNNQDLTILGLEGNVIMGGGASRLGQEIHRLLEEGKTRILLNFSGVKYIDSSGVGVLISSLGAVNQKGESLKISNLSKKVEEVLALSSILPMFEVYDDESEALSGASQ